MFSILGLALRFRKQLLFESHFCRTPSLSDLIRKSADVKFVVLANTFDRMRVLIRNFDRAKAGPLFCSQIDSCGQQPQQARAIAGSYIGKA